MIIPISRFCWALSSSTTNKGSRHVVNAQPFSGKSEPGPPTTLGDAAAAHARLIVLRR